MDRLRSIRLRFEALEPSMREAARSAVAYLAAWSIGVRLVGKHKRGPSRSQVIRAGQGRKKGSGRPAATRKSRTKGTSPTVTFA
jgi:hypothetical protein